MAPGKGDALRGSVWEHPLGDKGKEELDEELRKGHGWNVNK